MTAVFDSALRSGKTGSVTQLLPEKKEDESRPKYQRQKLVTALRRNWTPDEARTPNVKDHWRNASHFRRFALDCTGKRSATGKGNMKTRLSTVALVASAVTIAQANPGAVPAAKAGGPVARGAPAVHAPMRPGGVSSFRSTPMRSYGSRPFYSGQRSPSFGMRSSPSFAYRRPIYSSRPLVTRSGPYTVATIPQRNRVAPMANRRNPAVTRVWNQRNIGTQFPEWK